VAVGAESLSTKNDILVQHAKFAESHEVGIVVVSEREGVKTVQPTMVRVTAVGRLSNPNHWFSPWIMRSFAAPDIGLRMITRGSILWRPVSDWILVSERILMKSSGKNAKFGSPCPIGDPLQTIAGLWKGEILWFLQDGAPRRFMELRRLLSSVSPKVLTQKLRELERNGLITRVQFAEIPPKVEYTMTDLGRSAIPILAAIAEWWTDHADEGRAREGEADAEGGVLGNLRVRAARRDRRGAVALGRPRRESVGRSEHRVGVMGLMGDMG
jgi:DNA-binding HxlR family transcriptional regulator